ncbi:MAG: PepSY domain-containing protein [Phyllobacterium sp.]|uniref:PepSY domain-containing protein n=1 Tax=Phyllobacterium sp. TaxID=1871046 RepID=UPI0030F0C9AB
MKTRLKRFSVLALVGLLMAMPITAGADDNEEDEDHDLARDLHDQGDIRSLTDILAVVHAEIPGDVVAIDLVRREDQWVYRLQVVTPDGRRRIVHVDAHAGSVMRGKGND